MKSMRPIHYAIIALVLIVVLGLLYWRYRRAQQQNKSLEAELKVLQPYHKGPEPAPIFKKSSELKPSVDTKPVVPIPLPETVAPIIVKSEPETGANGSIKPDEKFNPFAASLLLQEPIFKLSTPTAIIPPTTVSNDDEDENDDDSDGEPPLLPTPTVVIKKEPEDENVKITVPESDVDLQIPLFAEPVMIMSFGVQSAPTSDSNSIDTGVPPTITEIVEDPQDEPTPEPILEPEVVATAAVGKKGPKRRVQASK
jgi:hypothetical protein